jgi:hypothetical protein
VQQNKVLLIMRDGVMHIGAVGFDAQAAQKMGNGFLRFGSRKFSNIAHDPSSSLAFVLTLLYPQIQLMNAPLMPENSKKMTTLRQIARPQVVVLAYDGLCTFEFGVAVEIFGLPRPSWATTGIVLPWRR